MLTLNAKTYGQGPALIVLHGLFGSLDNWVSFARQWSEFFTVYLLDQRNHGRSPHHEEWNYQVMAEDLFHFMDSEGIFQAHLLGHSMGGKTVMQFAQDYPERIDRLIVADMAPKSYEPHHEAVIAGLNAVDLQQVSTRQEVSDQLQTHIPEEGVRQFLLKGLGRDEKKRFAWKFNLPVITRDYEEVLKNIDGDIPFDGTTLFISGGKSSYVSEEDYPNILALFPRAQFVVLPEAGHWLHAEEPANFSHEVLNFLNI